MTDLSVIILTKNEQLHIKRCLERLLPLEPRQIFIVDCFSTDDTKSIVESFTSALQLQLPPTTKSPTLATNDQRLTTNRRYRTSTTATFSAKTSSRTKSALLGAVPDFDDSIAG